MTALAVAAANASHVPGARALAAELDLPVAGEDPPPSGLLLVLGDDGLRLSDPGDGASLRCELGSGRVGYRRRHGGGLGQALARAVGLRGGRRPSVLDATAGLGRDGFELAGLGCRVTLVERAPAIHALLRDGLARAVQHHPQTCARLRLLLDDALGLLARLAAGSDAARPEVVYLDPMHPPRAKAALVRKEMRLLRAAVGDDIDADMLLTAARRAARDRVVVKRPGRGTPLAGVAPDWTVAGRTTRYDVYRPHPADCV